MPDVFSRAKRRRIMQAVRRRNTAPEAEVARLLRALRVRFRRNVKSLPGEPDFLLPDAGLVVFVHGCFWHGHKRCRKGCSRPKTRRRYWQEKIARNQRRDRRVARKLRARGLRVFTVWECQIRQRGIPARILTALQAESP